MSCQLTPINGSLISAHLTRAPLTMVVKSNHFLKEEEMSGPSRDTP